MTQIPIVNRETTPAVNHPGTELWSSGDGIVSARPTGSTGRRAVDPLYPEPTNTARWVAEQPLAWLGPRRRQDGSRSLNGLIERGTVSHDGAAALALLVRRRASMLVVAGRSGVGKSTLLESLLPWYPSADRRIRLRGSFEDFGWARDPRFVPGQAVLVAEEISGHLPTYLWGPPVGRFLDFREAGCALAATAHGERIQDVGRLLCGYPLRLPIRSLAAFDLIIRLGPAGAALDSPSIVTDVWTTSQTSARGVVAATLFDRSGIRYDHLASVLQRLGDDGRSFGHALAEVATEIAATA